MTKLTNALLRVFLTTVILFTGLASTTGIAYADGEDLAITLAEVTVGEECGLISFSFAWENGTGSESYFVEYGNGDTTPLGEIVEISESSITIEYTYLAQGDFQWTFQIGDVSISDTLTIGPKVTLNSSPFPPLFVVDDTGVVDFSTEVLGGKLPLTYEWDLGVEGTLEGGTAQGIYTDVGKYYPEVVVTDNCGFTTTDTIPVIVADPEDICHPTAQKIADGVNTIFPDQSGDLYTCDDIYGIFDNESEENNLGFGRMWKAYHLAESMEELTWEDILDWHLNESGWGSLLQLDRFADLLEEHDLPELMGLVMSEDFSLGDVRTAVRSVTRYEADFDDALTRIADGANSGELGQFYKLAADLEADVEVLDDYLADGLTLSELKHTSKFADQMEVDWTEVADARGEADSWGDLKQAYDLATDGMSATQILIMGVQEHKESLREDDKGARELIREEDKEEQEQKAATQQEAQNNKTADKLAEQFTAEFGDVMNLLNGECEGDWACVRKALRDQEQEMAEGYSEKDLQTALQIGSKYGFLEEEVLAYHKDYCGENWACTRAYFRTLAAETKETGKPDKK